MEHCRDYVLCSAIHCGGREECFGSCGICRMVGFQNRMTGYQGYEYWKRWYYAAPGLGEVNSIFGGGGSELACLT